MIIIKFQGYLGNQMFQYALGRAVSWRTGMQVYYDKSWYRQPQYGIMPKSFELDTVFPLSLLFVEDRHVPLECRRIQGNYDYGRRGLMRCLYVVRTLLGLPHPVIFDYDSTEVRREVFKILPGQNVYLEGNWQSEQYFKDATSLVRDDFRFRTPPDSQNSALLERIAKDLDRGICSVSIHVRRGDYVSNPKINAFHGLLPLDYYRTAMSLIEQRLGRVSYYVFSDDPLWCRDNLKFEAPLTFVDMNAGKASYMDMRLMSACQHHIIANSSFSWWGAWLHESANKMVIAPRKWFSDARKIDTDVVPRAWLRV